jgi:hypothetical protein
MLVTLGLKLVAWHLQSLVLDTCRLKLSKYRRVGPGHWSNLFIWIMTPAPAAAVLKKIH